MYKEAVRFFDVEKSLASGVGSVTNLKHFPGLWIFEVFRPELNKALAYSDGSKGGRPPFDPVLVFQ